MKQSLYALAILLFLAFFTTSVTAQTLVKRSWVDTTGNPHDTLNLSFAERDGSLYFVLVGNTWPTSDSELILITKYRDTVEILRIEIQNRRTQILVLLS